MLSKLAPNSYVDCLVRHFEDTKYLAELVHNFVVEPEHNCSLRLIVVSIAVGLAVEPVEAVEAVVAVD